MAMFWRKQSLQPLKGKEEEDDIKEQNDKVNELRNGIGELLTGRSLKYCSEACLRRYLIARNWNVEKAKKMLIDTLQWRAKYKPEEISWSEVAYEGETGKVSKANFHDKLGRTVLIMRPGKQNSANVEGNVRHLVYLIENTILNLPEGQEQISWMIDFTGWTLNGVKMATARESIYILQNHYPERLGLIITYNPPKIFEVFYRVVKYFVDAKTKEKIHFVYENDQKSLEVMKTFFDTENLPSEFGGPATLKYDHQEFSKQMIQDDIKTAKYWGFEPKKLLNGCYSDGDGDGGGTGISQSLN